MLPKITRMQPEDTDQARAVVLADPTVYVFEQKIDGWSAVTYVDHGQVDLRSKHDNSYRGFDEIRRELLTLGFDEVIFDGDLACLGENQQPDFNLLMRRCAPVYYFIYDVLWLNGHDARGLPLLGRKEVLERVLAGRHEHLRFVPYYDAASASRLINRAQKRDLEGIVAKLKDAPYEAGIPHNWVKLKRKNYSQDKNRWQWFMEKK